eukprot:gnl/TRDRNA2_/TRDRNA2_142160_c2_seq1.p1 gnl/TRDRNA2_/TRDRNA2_142160_c2~~gnl/TRDRNA2_/TRDRNA2_142160_c2_seq1.p1  ORF type:complete len:101 (+),score=9.02 gnl/TRDRNA2_/TRDRNA2_142160_c2_seq1:238-540(+)
MLCVLSLFTCRSAAPDKPVKSFPSVHVSVADAHVALARPCVLNSLICRSAALVNVVSSSWSELWTVAKAHAVLETSCALNSPSLQKATFDEAAKSVVSDE